MPRPSLIVNTEALADDSLPQPSIEIDALRQQLTTATVQLSEKCEQLQAANAFVAEIQGQLAALQAQVQSCATEVSQVASTGITPSYALQSELQELQSQLQQSQQYNRELIDTVEHLEDDKVLPFVLMRLTAHPHARYGVCVCMCAG
jgi:chromosome segregation ATPase